MNAGLFHSVFLASSETLLNSLIAMDAAMPTKLHPLASKMLRVECDFPPLSFNMLVSENSILLMQGEADAANARVKGSAAALAGLLADNVKSIDRGSARNNRAVISGDTDFLQDLKGVLTRLDIDWEYQLSKVIGDIPTQVVSDCLAGTREFARQSADNLRDDLDAWLHEEKKLFPDASQLETYLRAVDRLRLSVDRLEARTNRLMADQQ